MYILIIYIIIIIVRWIWNNKKKNVPNNNSNLRFVFNENDILYNIFNILICISKIII